MKKKLLTLGLTAALCTGIAAQGLAGEAAPAEIAPQNLTLITTYSQNEYAGQLITHLQEKLDELSNGAIQMEVYWGGTVAAVKEQLSFVSTGSMDMTILGQSTYTDVLSLMNFPSQVLGGYEDSVNLIDYICFDNEETAPLVEAEIEKQNVHMIGSLPAGSNAFITKTEYGSLDEMKGLKLGIGVHQSAMESLGFNVVTMMPWDYYDQLSRGMADAGYMSVSALVSLKLQEVMPYFYKDGTYTAGNLVTINLDRWNSFDDATRALFEEAVEDTQAYAFETVGSMDDEAVTAIEAVGGSLNTLSEEDGARVQKAFFAAGVEDARAYAANAGTVDEMEIVLQAVAEYVGLELPE